MMMRIGEFALQSGLTVKALRHYDEIGLLVPARVDPETRYRTYSGAQLRAAVMIQVLRSAEVPVETVCQALAEPDQVDALIARFRSSAFAARAAQDAALAQATRAVAALEVEIPVFERRAEILHFVSVVQTLGVDPEPSDAEVDRANERANEAMAVLYKALCEQDNPPVGAFWSSFGPVDREGNAEMLLSWPVVRRPPAGFSAGALPTRAGTLPARRELVARWIAETSTGEDGPEGAEGSACHPAVVALLAEIDARGLECDLATLRQIGIMAGEGPGGVELAVAVS